ncbi:transmembrane protein 256 homolog [Sycon ciliatum]|uniref:transmembrane protein 256 homolog n=1 Tax=Sycon ciliatum TaxID=27933 RepID=UPI0020A9C175|eukprot:scpid78755/ scgid6830/ UPF0451 protein C17orf61 homolog
MTSFYGSARSCDCPECSWDPLFYLPSLSTIQDWLIDNTDRVLLTMEESKSGGSGGSSGFNRLPLVSRLVQPYRPLYRAIALSGALAVGLAAYSSHGFKPENQRYKEVFATATQYHLLHTVALLATPLTPRPKVFASLMGSGIVLFSGSCYVVALNENRELGRLAPLGGLLLIAGWLSLLL